LWGGVDQNGIDNNFFGLDEKGLFKKNLASFRGELNEKPARRRGGGEGSALLF